MIQERYFNTGEVSINFAEGPPSGPPLVLLHGLPGRWQEFLPLISSLALGWHIYALDSRGQGKSGRVPGKYLPQHYVEDFKAFLVNHLKEPAILFGFSAGGMAALEVAAQLPDLVSALILGDSPIDIEALRAWMSTDVFASHFSARRKLAESGLSVAEAARALGDLSVPVPGQDTPITYKELPGMNIIRLRVWAKTITQLDPDVLVYHAEGRSQEFLAGIDLDRIFQRITCPVLLLRGNQELGALMSAAAADRALSVLPEGMQVYLDKFGHDLGLDTWDIGPILSAVIGFLETL
jgi:pimeloyl-ACP methyl ester carboxylesterase